MDRTVRTKSTKNRQQTCGNEKAVFIDETQIRISSLHAQE